MGDNITLILCGLTRVIVNPGGRSMSPLARDTRLSPGPSPDRSTSMVTWPGIRRPILPRGPATSITAVPAGSWVTVRPGGVLMYPTEAATDTEAF